jgi:hypothetical protein
MEGQGGTRGAKEIVQGPGKVLECNRSMSEKTVVVELQVKPSVHLSGKARQQIINQGVEQ